MPTIQKIVNGNGQITVEPSGFEVPVNTIVTVRAYPYEGEIVDTAEFEGKINGVWTWVGVSEISHNVWRFRIEDYDMRINILFTSRYDPPPEPPEPPVPPTPFLNILPAILKRKQWWRY